MKMQAKKVITAVSFAMVMLCNSSCKDFLNVVPRDQLTGNNFYKSKEDVESNIANIYSTFFEKINETHLMGAAGEYRSGEVFVNPEHFRRNEGMMVQVLGTNNMLNAITNGGWYERFRLDRATNWSTYYRVIQGANILIDKLQQEEGIPGVTESDKKYYIAEATFIRCFTYFWMVRLYGDVVYYTAPYQSEPLGREAMVSVLNKCIEDMKSKMNDMPWTNPDPSKRGARASRGAAAALIMNMNMWNAGFDGAGRDKYNTEAAAMGEALVASRAYSLPPLSQWEQVVKGRSPESLFEFYRSINYNDQVDLDAPIGYFFLRWPYLNPRFDNQVSLCYYDPIYMMKIFPEDVADGRKGTLEVNGWFGDTYGGGVYSGEEGFVMTKFAHNIPAAGNATVNPDNTFMIFRYADAILMAAEAYANIDKEEDARRLLAMVRVRAEAAPYSGGGGSALKDFIFLERSREL
ncbi:hypothetical protein PBAL39_05833, partial [Pedobacter sp. BAL39]|uniref:RagB/SusD family nutrient uptake outer membrane protein n=1 Tax=Pedobacter sp. BAL39 TaxID=391596 RepID=UPI000155A4C8